MVQTHPIRNKQKQIDCRNGPSNTEPLVVVLNRARDVFACVCSILFEICALGCACFNESAEFDGPNRAAFYRQWRQNRHNRQRRPIQDYEPKSKGTMQVKSDRHLLSLFEAISCVVAEWPAAALFGTPRTLPNSTSCCRKLISAETLVVFV